MLAGLICPAGVKQRNQDTALTSFAFLNPHEGGLLEGFKYTGIPAGAATTQSSSRFMLSPLGAHIWAAYAASGGHLRAPAMLNTYAQACPPGPLEVVKSFAPVLNANRAERCDPDAIIIAGRRPRLLPATCATSQLDRVLCASEVVSQSKEGSLFEHSRTRAEPSVNQIRLRSEGRADQDSRRLLRLLHQRRRPASFFAD